MTIILTTLYNTFLSAEAINYRILRDNEKAKTAFEKASKGQEMIASYPSFTLSYSN